MMMCEARTRDDRSRIDSSRQDLRGSQQHCHAQGEGSGNCDLYEAELDVQKEKRNQKYLISMVTIFAICLCPLMVLRVAKMALAETYENSGHYDITYTLFVWIAFLPTCTTPGLFASWRMSRVAKERLRGYFRFSNRKLRRACEFPLEGQQQQHAAQMHNMAYTEHAGDANGICIAEAGLEGKHRYQQDLTCGILVPVRPAAMLRVTLSAILLVTLPAMLRVTLSAILHVRNSYIPFLLSGVSFRDICGIDDGEQPSLLRRSDLLAPADRNAAQSDRQTSPITKSGFEVNSCLNVVTYPVRDQANLSDAKQLDCVDLLKAEADPCDKDEVINIKLKNLDTKKRGSHVRGQ
ncbi:hypothetical protein Cfor_01274 [Coptotermes formosanus]|uniref:G-protein coupled receptors family 1 profile domain-containing protein n=1 Tax=Coptotermes formosanus TaxID=36987 RepID=A0A6L2Q3Z3_COPFO|nr:hypothetical protein Cfor_01274 [Coptotermes formosanus]